MIINRFLAAAIQILMCYLGDVHSISTPRESKRLPEPNINNSKTTDTYDSFKIQGYLFNGSSQMMTVPVISSSKPNNKFKTAHVKLDVTSEHPAFTTAFMQLNTSRPVVNLDNIAEIKLLKCSEGSLITQWDSEASALIALRLWSGVDKLAIIIGHESGCNNQNVAFLGITSMSVDRDILSIKPYALEKKQVILDWKLSVKQSYLSHDMIENKQMIYNQFSNFFDLINSHSSRKIRRFLSFEQLRMRLFGFLGGIYEWENTSYFDLPLNSNYNETTHEVIENNITIYDNHFLLFKCANCYTKGYIAIEATLKGSMAGISFYHINATGSIEGNSDFRLSRLSRYVTPVPVWTKLSLGELKVNGLFSLKPSFQIKAGVSVEAEAFFDVKYGWNYMIPLNVKITSDVEDISIVNDNSLILSSSFYVHSMQITNGTAFRVATHFTPKMSLGLTVLDIPLSFSLNYDTSLRFEVSSGDLRVCPREKVNIVMYNRQILHITISIAGTGIIKPKVIWKHRSPVACAFCNRCPREESTNDEVAMVNLADNLAGGSYSEVDLYGLAETHQEQDAFDRDWDAGLEWNDGEL